MNTALDDFVDILSTSPERFYDKNQYNLPEPIKLLAACKCFGREESEGSGVSDTSMENFGRARALEAWLFCAPTGSAAGH